MSGQPSWDEAQNQAQAIAESLGEGGLFLADRDGELLAVDPESVSEAQRLFQRRPCAVFGCWRSGGLLARDPVDLPPSLRAERLADARLYGWDPQRVEEPAPAERAACCARLQAGLSGPAPAERAACCARLQAGLSAACADLDRVWLACAYRERGRPLAVEPAVVVAGAIDAAWVLAQAGGCNQQHIAWAAAGDRELRPQMAQRDAQGGITAYRPIAGSPPRLRLVVMPRS